MIDARSCALAGIVFFAAPALANDELSELRAIIAERDRQYSQRFEAQEKAVAAALAAQEKATAAAFSAASTAVSKAELANEKRLDSVNEFRGQLKDQASLLATRSEVATQLRALSDKIDGATSSINEMRSRWDGASMLWTVIAAALGLGLGLLVAGLAWARSRQKETP